MLLYASPAVSTRGFIYSRSHVAVLDLFKLLVLGFNRGKLSYAFDNQRCGQAAVAPLVLFQSFNKTLTLLTS